MKIYQTIERSFLEYESDDIIRTDCDLVDPAQDIDLTRSMNIAMLNHKQRVDIWTDDTLWIIISNKTEMKTDDNNIYIYTKIVHENVEGVKTTIIIETVTREID